MRGYYTSWVSLLILLHTQVGVTQQMARYVPDRPVICYQSHEDRPDHVGVSDHFARLRHAPAGRAKTANFEVEYINFPEDDLARSAFQYAIEIWESELVSSVPIRVRAEWRELDAGVLGQTLWGSAYANFGNEQHLNTYYPVALAEKISRRELNAVNEADIVASFNSKTAWYLATDGNTPSGKMDLVTIVLHEIGHGLGFTDSYSVKDNMGTVGLSNGAMSVPFIFDVFVENGSGKNLLHDFELPSSALASALQNADLFFDGPLSAASLNETKPELFAPNAFVDGSSISHLDEGVFSGAQDANRLMTPQIDFAESIHDPGDLLLAILGDMGWVYTHIDHVRLRDTERMDGQPYVVTVALRSDNGYHPETVKLHYTTDGVEFTTVNMSPTGEPDQFQSFLPGTNMNRSYAYYISVADDDNRIFTNPGKMQEPGSHPEQQTHFFNIGPDTDPPGIIHEPVTWVFDHATHLELTAKVTDNQAVEQVRLRYAINDGVIQTTAMTGVAGSDQYSASVSLPEMNMGDVIKYSIIATDVASTGNTSTLPQEGFFEITVTGIMAVQNEYANDFDKASPDFFGTGFQISTPQGFANGAIHTDHPYPNGTGTNDESNFTYQLQVPIRVSSVNPFIRFDEIVLVEPGDEGSEFGSDDFYDYVVVEGSVDGGATWLPFADGYDSRANSVWLSRYNSDLSDDNSRSTGNPDLYRTRTINMLASGNFSSGDEVLIRFRLFADQLAHGWGWAIDNLAIQSPVTDLENPVSRSFSVYPVPVHDILFIVLDSPREPVAVEITDLQGRLLYADVLYGDDVEILEGSIDVRFLTNGLYVLTAKMKNQIHQRKFLKN